MMKRPSRAISTRTVDGPAAGGRGKVPEAGSMTGGRRDAQIAVRTLRRGAYTNVDASLDYLISRAYKSPDRGPDALHVVRA